MERWILLMLLALGPATAEIYKWVDERGVVHYGDQPPNSKVRPLQDLPGLSTYRPPSPSLTTTPPPQPAAPNQAVSAPAQAPATYTTLRIVSPEDQGTVRSNPGEVPLFVALDPPLRKGHYLRVRLDGKLWPGRFTSTVIRLNNMDRGEHRVSVAVYDAGGRRLLESPPHIFYLHRTIAQRRSAR